MKNEATRKIIITLPQSVYHSLRGEAHKQNVSLPEFIKKKVQLRPAKTQPAVDLRNLADLPLKKILAITAPKMNHPDERIDFFS